MRGFNIAVTPDIFRQAFKLLAWKRDPARREVTVISKIELMTYSQEEAPLSSDCPGIDLDATGAQALMDSLWDVGIRPTKGSGSAGSFEAQARHLEDMRALVFGKAPNKI